MNQAGVEKFAIRSTNLLFLSGKRRNCLRSGRSRSLYLYIRRTIKQTSSYSGISLLTTTYKILSNILLSRLTPYGEEIIGDHQGGFRRDRSTADHIFCIRQILMKKWEDNEAVHQLFIEFKKAYVAVRSEVRYNILNEFGILIKVVRLIKMCLTQTYNRVPVGENLSGVIPIMNGFKQGFTLSPLLFNYALNYAIRCVEVNQDGLKLNGTHQFPVYADNINILRGSVHTITKNAEALVVASKEIGIELNADKPITGHVSRSEYKMKSQHKD